MGSLWDKKQAWLRLSGETTCHLIELWNALASLGMGNQSQFELVGC
jgi:hypothetical protein